jgi:hypothetical protein
MKKNRFWQVFILFILSLAVIGCNAQNVKQTNIETISYLKDNVDNSESLLIESINWAIDEEGRITYLISYDTENESGQYLGYITCIVVYDDSPEDRIHPGAQEWIIVFENDDDAFDILLAKYNMALSDEELDSGELSTQEIDEILLELSSSK